MSSRPTLVADHVPLWQHRSRFLVSFAEVALSAIDDLRLNIYPLYKEARDAFPRGETVGFVFNEHEEGYLQVLFSYAINTPFCLYKTLGSQYFIGVEAPKLEERRHLQRELLSWAERYRLSPRYWSESGEWFLNQIVNALEDWFHIADESSPLSTVVAHNNLPATVSFDLPLGTFSFQWNLHEENIRALKERIKKEVSAGIDEIVSGVALQAITQFKGEGFTEPETRHNPERDMGWLIEFQCFKNEYKDIADSALSKENLDSDVELDKLMKSDKSMNAERVRKAVERRAEDVALIPWTKI